MSHLHERMCGVVGTEYSILWALSRFFARRRVYPRISGRGCLNWDFGDLELDRMASYGLSVVWRVGGRCLNQDFRDLGIFRIAGDRLMPVEHILYASGERADCRGTINWDAPRSLGLSQISWWTLSEAGFTGLLGIFGIAGNRLMPVQRIPFAWSVKWAPKTGPRAKVYNGAEQ